MEAVNDDSFSFRSNNANRIKTVKKIIKRVFIPTKRRTKVSHTGNYVKIPLLE